VNKWVKDNKVAVILSNSHAGGWSTWWDNRDEMLFDPDLALLISNDTEKKVIDAYIEDKYGIDNPPLLRIEWLNVGVLFAVKEYDGLEYIELQNDVNWVLA